MKRLDAEDLKTMNLLKHYRIIRKWACRNNNLNDADIELLIYSRLHGYVYKTRFRSWQLFL
jgi:hypothetical protein